MIWLCLVGVVCCCYGMWLTRHIGGPFRPIRNEIEELCFQSLGALAIVLLMIGALVGI